MYFWTERNVYHIGHHGVNYLHNEWLVNKFLTTNIYLYNIQAGGTQINKVQSVYLLVV